MRIRHLALPTVAALGASLLVPATAAHADAPWATNTVFVAESGQRFGSGSLHTIGPDGRQTILGFGSTEDVTVAPDGTVYWVECSGGLYRFTPGSSGLGTLIADPGNCPTSVAMAPNGHLIVGNFSGLGDYDSNGVFVGLLTSQETGVSSIAIDPDGNRYFTDGAENLEVWPVGGSPAPIVGLFGGHSIDSIRLDSSYNMIAADTVGSAVLKQSPLGPLTTRDQGYFTDGAAVDGDGTLYGSVLQDNPATHDSVSRTVGGTSTTLVSGLDTPKGMSVWPPVSLSPRSTSSVSFSASTSTLTTIGKVTLTAQVVGAPSGTSGGYVQFTMDGQAIGHVARVTDGFAIMRTGLPQGTHHVIATYLGSSIAQPSQSDSATIAVAGLRTTTTLTTDTLAPVQSQQASFTVHVANLRIGQSTPTGTVDFLVDGHFFTSSDVNPAGDATALLHFVKPGPATVRAIYEGDPTYSTSSDQLSVTPVAPFRAGITATNQYGATFGNGNERVSIRVVVSGLRGLPAPTGTITANSGYTCTPPTGTVALATTCSGVAPPGFSYVDITYGGDATYAGVQGTVQVVVGEG